MKATPDRIRGSALAALLFAALAGASPAAAFDPLESLLRSLPPAEGGGFGAFDYVSPRTQAAWPVMAMQGVGVDEIAPALLDRDVGLAMAGIAFPDLDGILRAGEPPDTILYLYGPAIDPDAMRGPLLARPGMTEAREGGFVTFSVGADHAIDPGARENGYPFGGGWRAHRVAVRPGWAAVAFATPTLTTAIAAIVAQDAGERPDTPVVAMIGAAGRRVPEGFVTYAASGIPGEAFLGATGVVLPSYAVVLGSTGADWEAAQFLLLFDLPAAAEIGAPALAATLATIRAWPEGAKVLYEAVPLAEGAAAVVTVLFPPGTQDHPSSRLLNSWRADIQLRRLFTQPVAP